MFRRIFTYKYFPLAFTIFTIILLCIPGSLVPGTGFFAAKNLDKVVHAVLFGMNVLFWGWHFEISRSAGNNLKSLFIGASIFMMGLGVVMEYVQMYFIPNRSFDGYDILADIVGSVLAALWLLKG